MTFPVNLLSPSGQTLHPEDPNGLVQMKYLLQRGGSHQRGGPANPEGSRPFAFHIPHHVWVDMVYERETDPGELVLCSKHMQSTGSSMK